MVEMASVEFFLGHSLPEVQGPSHHTCTEELIAGLDMDLIQSIPHPGLLPRFRQPVFVHIYSGRRREGDLQSQIEAIDWSPDLTPIVVSLDLMVDRSRCDMMNPEQRRFWLQKAYEGAIDGGLSGPPCETWTAARHNTLNTATEPRPLRSAVDLWSLEGLAVREQEQVFVANTLLGFSLHFQFIMWLRGRWAGLEHPKEPDNPSYAAIWRLPIVQMMLQLPGMQRFTVLQGFYGGKSPKPTDLMFSHAAPGLPALALRTRTTSLPPPIKMGKSDKGKFYNTAVLKEYPSAFCNFLALSFAAWAKHRPVEPASEDLPESLLTQFERLRVDLTKSVEIFGPDFAG